jgi:hypothetical protein
VEKELSPQDKTRALVDITAGEPDEDSKIVQQNRETSRAGKEKQGLRFNCTIEKNGIMPTGIK